MSRLDPTSHATGTALRAPPMEASPQAQPRGCGKSKYKKVSTVVLALALSRPLYHPHDPHTHDAEATAAFRSRVPVSRYRPPPYNRTIKGLRTLTGDVRKDWFGDF